MEQLSLDLIKQNLPEQADDQAILAFFLNVFEHAPNVFFVKDKDGRYLLVNKEFERFVNLPLESIIGKTDFDIMNERDAIECVASDQPAKDEPGKVHISFEVERAPNGDIASYLSVNKQVVTTSIGDMLIGIVTRVAA